MDVHVSVLTHSEPRTNGGWGVLWGSHSKQQRNQTTSTNPPSPHDNTIVAEAECVCVCAGIHSGGAGHLGFLQRAKQMVLGRFTSPSGQTDNIDKVCHNKKQAEPEMCKLLGREWKSPGTLNLISASVIFFFSCLFFNHLNKFN